jgi:hypothetical protein
MLHHDVEGCWVSTVGQHGRASGVRGLFKLETMHWKKNPSPGSLSLRMRNVFVVYNVNVKHIYIYMYVSEDKVALPARKWSLCCQRGQGGLIGR